MWFLRHFFWVIENASISHPSTYAICLYVKSFWHCPDQPADSCYKEMSNFSSASGSSRECSVELKCVSVHFKWPCWSLRCLVKPVKMACLPSPGFYRCRKSIMCIGCNLDNCAESWTAVPRAQYHDKDTVVVPAVTGLPWVSYGMIPWPCLVSSLLSPHVFHNH